MFSLQHDRYSVFERCSVWFVRCHRLCSFVVVCVFMIVAFVSDLFAAFVVERCTLPSSFYLFAAFVVERRCAVAACIRP